VPSAEIIITIKGEEGKVAAIPPTLKSSLDEKMKRCPTCLIKKG
jgi:hypothetical protein